MNIKRYKIDLILKHSQDKKAENIIKIVLTSTYFNVITCGEIRNPEQSIEKIKERLASKYCDINIITCLNNHQIKNENRIFKR